MTLNTNEQTIFDLFCEVFDTVGEDVTELGTVFDLAKESGISQGRTVEIVEHARFDRG